MILGTVIGQLWGAVKAERLAAHTLLVIRPEQVYRAQTDHLIAIDEVGAEVGQRVVVVMGAPGRWHTGDGRTPIDAAVCAIVDSVEMEA